MHLYPLSSDPFHQGHYTIWKKSQKIFGEDVGFLLSQNPEKSEGLLSVSQRYKDLVISLLTYGVVNGECTKDTIKGYYNKIKGSVVVSFNSNDLLQNMADASGLIRGFRNEEDKLYSINLLKKVGNSDRLNKTFFVEQDEVFKNISSTKYKLAYSIISSDINQYPLIYTGFNKIDIDQKCYNFASKAGNNLESNELNNLTFNIKLYFDQVQDLENLGYFKGLKI